MNKLFIMDRGWATVRDETTTGNSVLVLSVRRVMVSKTTPPPLLLLLFACVVVYVVSLLKSLDIRDFFNYVSFPISPNLCPDHTTSPFR